MHVLSTNVPETNYIWITIFNQLHGLRTSHDYIRAVVYSGAFEFECGLFYASISGPIGDEVVCRVISHMRILM